MCLTPKASEELHMHNVFRTRGTIKGKTVNIIIDNRSTDNLISSRTAEALKLSIVGLEQKWGGYKSNSDLCGTYIYWKELL